MFVLYGLSGYVYTTWHWLRSKKKTPKPLPAEEK
jgi:hypothetical protein